MLDTYDVLTGTLHVDKNRFQVRSRPLQRHVYNISLRFQVTGQNYVITNCCYYWLRWSNQLRLTWKRNTYDYSVGTSSFSTTVLCS